MSDLTLGGALEQLCEKRHNVKYITLEGLSSDPGKYNLRARAHSLGRVSDAAFEAGPVCAAGPGVRRAGGAPGGYGAHRAPRA